MTKDDLKDENANSSNTVSGSVALTIELVPKTAWYSNVRSNVTAEEWDKIRKKSYSIANNKCEICGDIGKNQGVNHNVECHEIWQPNRYPGGRSRERGNARVLCRGTIEVGRWNIPIETQKAGMGIDWISNLRKLSESIPPAYTKFIGEQIVSLHCW